MTTPTLPPPPPRPTGTVAAWILRPRVILGLLAIVLIITILNTPERGTSDLRLTTYSAGPASAKGLFEVATRLGWPTERRLQPFRAPLDTTAVYAVLGGPVSLTLDETRALLDAVRHGAGLIYVMRRDPLEDSIPLRIRGNGVLAASEIDTTGCDKMEQLWTLSWLGAGVRLFALSPRHPLPADTAVFVSVETAQIGQVRDSSERMPPIAPAVVGYPLGRGRVVVVSDPDVLRNDVVRMCRLDVGYQAVRAIAWASHEGRPPLVFDEYHQGYGMHASLEHALGVFFASVPLGHVILQLVLGALILLVALGVRAIPPRGVRPVERRSAIEHVEALARAYEQIDATRTVARRLVRGLRRRHGRASWSSVRDPKAAPTSPDAQFLSMLTTSRPETRAEVNRLIAAEERGTTPEGLLEVSDAVDRLDDVLSGNRSLTRPPFSHPPSSA